MTVSMQMVRDGNAMLGHHWFDKDTIRFFKSRVSGSGFTSAAIPTAMFFTSSEQAPGGKRRWSVRLAVPTRHPRLPDYPDGYLIQTIGEFQAYKTSVQAQAEAERLARLSWDELPPEIQELFRRTGAE